MFLIEWSLVLLALIVAFAAPAIGSHWFEVSERGFAKLARRRGMSVLVVGLTALVLRAAVLPVLPVPEPSVHDEFSYLLMADTFAHGRLANPTHPMWVHFETFHVNQKPTYSPMFYPAHGVLLAAGQLVFGHPFWGVWLSVGLMCAAICWALQAWLPLEWALLGGFLAAIRIGTFSYWADSFRGGPLAAIGGALVLGALPRIKRSQSVTNSLLMTLGLAILANSRPYEGMFFSIPALTALLLWIIGKNRPPLKQSLQQTVAPLSLALVLTATAMLYYFWRTTGSPFRTPYLVNVVQYNPVPYFPFQSMRPWPEYHHALIKRFFLEFSLPQYEFARLHPVRGIVRKFNWFWSFFIGPALTLPLLVSFMIKRNGSRNGYTSGTGFLILVFCVSFLGLLLPIYFAPHYAAPLTAAFYALLLVAMQRLRRWEWHGERNGLCLMRAVPVICVIMLVLRTAAAPLHISLSGLHPPTWYEWSPKSFGRAGVLRGLQELPGQHLVIVQYGPAHDPLHEWVYNESDIDAAKVVWARDMGPEKNQELVAYFKKRDIWLVEADEKPVKVSRYCAVPNHPYLSQSPGVP